MKPTFEGWMKLVDIHLQYACGFSHDDLEDYFWFDNYEAGEMPIDAAYDCLFALFPSIDWNAKKAQAQSSVRFSRNLT